jgi:hypothetical protein
LTFKEIAEKQVERPASRAPEEKAERLRCSAHLAEKKIEGNLLVLSRFGLQKNQKFL